MKPIMTIKTGALGIFVSLVGLQNTFCQLKGEAISTTKPFRIVQKLPAPIITILAPNVPKGTYYNVIQETTKYKIQGTVKAKSLSMLTVDKIETKVNENGTFTQAVSLKNGDNHIVIKAVDFNSTVTLDTVLIHRADSDDAANKYNGTNYALLIGTNKYQAMSELVNPCFDIRTISEELTSYYETEVDTLMNPSTDDIFLALKKYGSMTFKDSDQLFIMISGHGEYDDIYKDGFIVPSDAKKNDISKRSYIAHSQLRTIINNIPCKHIFVTLDVCFGGTFDQAVARATRGIKVEIDEPTDRDRLIERKLQYRTRKYLTSGGKVYVPDGRPGQHSPFARKFIEALRTYGNSDKLLTMNELMSHVETVTPAPKHGDFGDCDPDNDFLFMAKRK